jgi:tetratricopeptide (TPR) repeat protein
LDKPPALPEDTHYWCANYTSEWIRVHSLGLAGFVIPAKAGIQETTPDTLLLGTGQAYRVRYDKLFGCRIKKVVQALAVGQPYCLQGPEEDITAQPAATVRVDFHRTSMVSWCMMRILILSLFFLILWGPPAAMAANYGSAILNFLKGYRSESQGDYDQAVKSYGEALKADPESIDIRNELALAHFRNREFGKAEKLLDEVLHRDPKNRNGLIMLGGIYASRGDHQQALAMYEKVLEADPEDPEVYLYLGSVYIDQKNFEEAIRVYKKIIAHDDTNVIATYYLGRLSGEVKRYEEARSYYRKVLELKPGFEPALSDMATIYEIEGNFDRALEYYQKVLMVDPSNKRARAKIAGLFVRKRDYDRAINEYEKLSDMDREDLSVRVKIGILHLEQERYDEAIREFNLSLASNPNDNAARLYLAMAWRGRGDAKRAIDELLKVDPASKEFPGALQTLTALYIKGELVDEGIKAMRFLLDRKKDPEVYLMLAILYEEKEDHNASREALEEALKLNADNTDALYQLGMLLEKMGDNEKALTYMERVLKIDPEHANALNFIGYSWAEKGIRLDEAEAMIKKALSQKPDDGFIVDSLGWVYYKKGDLKGALTELLKAHELLPDDPTIAEHLGDTYSGLADSAKAIEYYKKAHTLEKKEDKKSGILEKLQTIQPKKP